jgi:RNA polymerase-binding transcription factor DksA
MDIGLGRLRALPTATLCVDCATAREKRQRAMGGARDSDRLLLNKEVEDGFAMEDAE